MLRRLRKLVQKERVSAPQRTSVDSPVWRDLSSANSEREYSMADWKPRYPALWSWEAWRDAMPHWEAIQRQEWAEILEPIGKDIYRFQCFEPAFLRQLSAEIAVLDRWSREKRVDINPPNSMHDYGIELSVLGLESVIQSFVSEIATHVVPHCFPDFADYPVDHHHSFTVTYGENHNRSLGFHADDSEVTFNFCLGDSFVGSELYFQGRRCFEHLQTLHRPEEHIEVEQIAGQCIVHAGMHRHGVLPILQGERRALIIWTRSRAYRSQRPKGCADWCAHQEEVS